MYPRRDELTPITGAALPSQPGATQWSGSYTSVPYFLVKGESLHHVSYMSQGAVIQHRQVFSGSQ